MFGPFRRDRVGRIIRVPDKARLYLSVGTRVWVMLDEKYPHEELVRIKLPNTEVMQFEFYWSIHDLEQLDGNAMRNIWTPFDYSNRLTPLPAVPARRRAYRGFMPLERRTIPHNVATAPRGAFRGNRPSDWYLCAGSGVLSFVFLNAVTGQRIIKTPEDGWTREDADSFHQWLMRWDTPTKILGHPK